jgi:ribosomal-protein-alanine N-acetyltransferase
MSSLIVAGTVHTAVMAAIHAGSFPPAERWGEAAIAAQLGLPGTFGLLAPAGGLVLARVVADEAEILTLAVLPEMRRQGRGRALLAAAAARAAACGAAVMYLEVAEDNAAAKAMYAAAGYVPVGRRPGYYPGGAAALVLRKRLIPAAAGGG